MFIATSNPANQLLVLNYVGRVDLAELQRHRGNLRQLLAGLAQGFRVLADFSQLEAMDPDCLPEIAAMMEVLDETGVALVVRVIPDPRKDPGMNILSNFHYRMPPRVVACCNWEEALRALAL